jgi:hypothetical protein
VALCIIVRQTNYSRATTLPRYGMGPSLKFVCFSAGSLNYIRVRGTLKIWYTLPRNPGCPREWGNTYHGISRAAGRHLGSPIVAPELRSGGGTVGACRGGRLHRVDTHSKVDGWKTLIDYLNPAYLCMTVRGGIPTDLSNLVCKVYNLCRV